MTGSRFRNYTELATTPNRILALNIAAAGLAALNPEILLRKFVARIKNGFLEIAGHSFSTTSGRIFVIGGGKASDVMAAAVENILGPESITAGIVTCKTQSAWPDKIQVREAGHPIPDQRGSNAMNEIMAMKDKHEIDKNDLVICLLSGGASALMPLPAPGITLEDKQALTRMLLASGADIATVNIVRKHLSASKGGKLGRHFAPATVISLIVSDVIGNDVAAIGSGPTAPEKTRPRDAMEIIRRHGLWDEVPAGARDLLEVRGDQPPLDDLPNCSNHIIGDSNTALDAMLQKAEEMGTVAHVISTSITGVPEAAARKIATDILDGKYRDYDVLLAAGETTPVLPRNHGRGGRNQHFAAGTLSALRDLPGNWTHLSLGSDGSDYLPDVAGALVDGSLTEKIAGRELNLSDFLDRFDTNSLFTNLGGCLVETGPTGTNVSDLMIYVL